MSIESLCTGAFLVGADLGQRSIGDEPGPSTPCLIFCPRPAHKPAPLSLPSLPQSKRYFACTRTESPGANGGSDHCRETRTDQSPQKRAGAAEPEQYLFRQLNSTIRVAAIDPNHGSRHIAGCLRREQKQRASQFRWLRSSAHGYCITPFLTFWTLQNASYHIGSHPTRRQAVNLDIVFNQLHC